LILCSIGDEALPTLVQFFKFNHTLERLNLRFCSFTDNGKKDLRQAIGEGLLTDPFGGKMVTGDYIYCDPHKLAYLRAPWKEFKHHQLDTELRWLIFQCLLCYYDHDSDEALLPWDDFRHVLDAWSMSRKKANGKIGRTTK